MKKVYLTGDLVDEADAKISVFDHGLMYGDGVFEGIRLYQGCVFKLEAHLERLVCSAKAIMLDLPWTREEISQAVCETCRANGLTDGYIRLIVTRGVGSLGLNPFGCRDPQIIIIADKIQLYPNEYYEEGLKVITVASRRINPAALPPMIKSLNYLNNIMAKIDALTVGRMEAIMLNDQGVISECTGDNVFVVCNGEVHTPPAHSGVLKGITREVVFGIAEELDVKLVETVLTRYDLWVADECFLTGTAAEIIPVTEIDGRVIGSGRRGEVTEWFTERFRSKTAVEGTLLYTEKS